MSAVGDEPVAKRARQEESASGSAPIPITLLSGFLGAGKTTMLKHLLQNKAGLRVGVVVNDVAEINIDASLVAVRSGEDAGGAAAQGDTVEMANGCLSCSASEELLQSIEKLMGLSKVRKLDWDHLVIETTGVAEPKEVRDNLASAYNDSPELLCGTQLHTLVTVVDSSTFMSEYTKRNKVEEREDLGSSEFTDGSRQVVDLMCEQIECADILVANKTDLVTSNEASLLKETLASLNPHAKVISTERGRVELTKILAAAPEGGVASFDGEENDFERFVNKVKENEARESEHLHGHGHDDHAVTPSQDLEGFEHGHDAGNCTQPAHEHSHAQEEVVHGHGHADGLSEHDGKKATAHGHGHSESDASESVTHAHDHSQSTSVLGRPVGREAKRFGITSFCYQRRRPFHPQRLLAVIQQMPVKQQTHALAQALEDDSGVGSGGGESAAPTAGASQFGSSPLHALIRSKGFIWLSNSHQDMFYWALAGKHFELKTYASWWNCVPRDEWPMDPEELAKIAKDFEGEFGDHRQELVFIGVRMDKEAIVRLMDTCLLTEHELAAYRKYWSKWLAP